MSELKFTGSISGYQIKVTLIVGEYGEHSKDIDFEILIDSDFSGFTVEHLTDERKKERIQGAISGLERYIKKGEDLLERFRYLTGDSIQTQGFYSEIYNWRWDTEALISKRFGKIVASKFGAGGKLKEFPDKFTTKNVDGLNEFYSRLLTLKQMTKELKEANPLP